MQLRLSGLGSNTDAQCTALVPPTDNINNLSYSDFKKLFSCEIQGMTEDRALNNGPSMIDSLYQQSVSKYGDTPSGAMSWISASIDLTNWSVGTKSGIKAGVFGTSGGSTANVSNVIPTATTSTIVSGAEKWLTPSEAIDVFKNWSTSPPDTNTAIGVIAVPVFAIVLLIILSGKR